LRGELIGINTAIIAPGGGNVGIGFAIPSNMVDKVVQHLVKFGEVRRGTLGIRIQDLTPDLADAFRLSSNKGAVIVEVEPGTAADKAGLKSGDIITVIDNKPVGSATDVRNLIGLLSIGEKVKITIVRNGRTHHLSAVIAKTDWVEGSKIHNYLEGAILKDSNEGIQVREVTQHSTAWKIGFRSGDIIVGFNRRKVDNIKELTQLSSQLSSQSIQIRRNDEILSIWLD
jgi:S1-C subfamily serine protease